MKNILLILPLIIVFFSLPAQENISSLEITSQDITKFPGINAESISVFGIQLGMSPNDVNEVLKNNQKLNYYVDELHSSSDFRIYVYDKDEKGNENNCILYLIWTNNRKDLNKITFFEDIKAYMIGQTKELLEIEIYKEDSKLAETYLGKPDHSEVTLNIPSIGLYHKTYFYDSKGMKFTYKKSKDKISSVFGFYKK